MFVVIVFIINNKHRIYIGLAKNICKNYVTFLKYLLSVVFLHHYKSGYLLIFLPFFIIYCIKTFKLTIKIIMDTFKTLKIIIILFISSFFLSSCGDKLPGADARKYDPDPKKRVAKNLEEGRGFRLSKGLNKSNGFDFANSNELWRASLDTIDFMPLASVNYSGGIIITDWYSTDQTSNESIKISIRFLTNEIRSDALDIKVFSKTCKAQLNCKISERKGNLVTELTEKILKTAAVYAAEINLKNLKPYKGKQRTKF